MGVVCRKAITTPPSPNLPIGIVRAWMCFSRYISAAATIAVQRSLLQVRSKPRPALGPHSLPRHFHPSSVATSQRSFPAWFVRSGTSNGLVINQSDLGPQSQWHTALPAAMGSPDPQHARQLDGMGSGISSTSKIIILGPPSRSDIDVDYTFVQVGIRDGKLDMAGNCGNMSSAVGPVAWDWGFVADDAKAAKMTSGYWAELRLLNKNTNKVLSSRFKVAGSPPRYSSEGDHTIDGVPGSGSQITLTFLSPGGSKTGRTLPTGKPKASLRLPDGTRITASLVDVSNPGVFVAAEDLELGKGKELTPTSVEANSKLTERLEEIRRAGAAAMGLDPTIESVPKVLMLRKPEKGTNVDIVCQAISMGQAHKAVPLTLALCLGAACQIPGTIAAELCSGTSASGVMTIGHPSGRLEVATTMGDDGEIKAAHLLRTMRVLMKGDVCY